MGDGGGWSAVGGIGLSLIFAAVVLTLLPVSPFQAFIQALDTSGIIQFLAWIVPVGPIQSILQAWLLAITAFYVVMMLARWIKMID